MRYFALKFVKSRAPGTESGLDVRRHEGVKIRVRFRMPSYSRK